MCYQDIAAADVVDGNVQVVLGLVWRLILTWQNVLKVAFNSLYYLVLLLAVCR